MQYFLALFLTLLLFSCQATQPIDSAIIQTPHSPPKNMPQQQAEFSPVLVIHGGAGTLLKKNMTADMEKSVRNKLTEALNEGYAVLQSGGTALDAVSTSIVILEDSPLFNAGKGAVFTHDGKNEMDASIMEGKHLNAGAVAGISTVKNPILAAKAVLSHSEHVLLSYQGAENFAQQQGLNMVAPSYFYTQKRWDYLQRIKEKEKNKQKATEAEKHGTVGACALDKYGNLAAGTSTGGMTNKKFDRIGDSPIIGAGTYANNATCAVSCTGHGEYFIRHAVAHSISAQMEYGKKSLSDAANFMVLERLVEAGGTGGLIAIDQQGNIVMPFNTTGMYRGYKTAHSSPQVFIFKDE